MMEQVACKCQENLDEHIRILKMKVNLKVLLEILNVTIRNNSKENVVSTHSVRRNNRQNQSMIKEPLISYLISLFRGFLGMMSRYF